MTDRHADADAAWGDVEPRPLPLARGPWSAELRADEVADLRFRGVVVLRSVRAVLRDRDWGTVPVSVTAREHGADGIDLRLEFRGLGAELDAVLRVRADGDVFSVEFLAENRVDFLRCRVGLVVLHPPQVAGSPMTVTHPDGTTTPTRFPVAVSPHQPAFDIARLDWSTAGIGVGAAFEGEVFEMEDQRNWTDASFKTYGTPLDRPFPVLLGAGETVRQKVVVHAQGSPHPAPAPRRPRLVATGASFPELVLGAATGPEAEVVAGLPPRRLVELDLRDANWRAALNRAAGEVPTGVLDVRLVAEGPADVGPALAALRDLPVERLGVFSATSHVTEPGLWSALVDALGRDGGSIRLVGGARSHYTELNRQRSRLPQDIPALTFSLTPQMHATERAQLVESVPMIRVVVEDARSKSGGRPLHVGPITLRPRFNAVATTAPVPDGSADVAAGYGAERVPGTSDPRQFSTAAGAWFAAAVLAAAVPGVESVAVAESWGDRGVARASHPAALVLAAVRALTPLAGLPMLIAQDWPDHVWAVGVRDDDVLCVVAANLEGTPVRVVAEVDDAETTVTVDVPAWGVVSVRVPPGRSVP